MEHVSAEEFDRVCAEAQARSKLTSYYVRYRGARFGYWIAAVSAQAAKKEFQAKNGGSLAYIKAGRKA